MKKGGGVEQDLQDRFHQQSSISAATMRNATRVELLRAAYYLVLFSVFLLLF